MLALCGLKMARHTRFSNIMHAATFAGCTRTPAGRDGRPGAPNSPRRPLQRSQPAAGRPAPASGGSRRVQRPRQAATLALAAAAAAAQAGTAPPLPTQLELGNLQVAAEFVFTVPGLCTLRARASLEGERGACCACGACVLARLCLAPQPRLPLSAAESDPAPSPPHAGREAQTAAMTAAALVNLRRRQRLLDAAVAAARQQLPGVLDAAGGCRSGRVAGRVAGGAKYSTKPSHCGHPAAGPATAAAAAAGHRPCCSILAQSFLCHLLVVDLGPAPPLVHPHLHCPALLGRPVLCCAVLKEYDRMAAQPGALGTAMSLLGFGQLHALCSRVAPDVVSKRAGQARCGGACTVLCCPLQCWLGQPQHLPAGPASQAAVPLRPPPPHHH